MSAELHHPFSVSLSQAATKLEDDIASLQRLSEQIEQVDVKTDGGLNHARKLMARFSEFGNSVSEGVQNLAQALGDAQVRAEKAAAVVSARADLVKIRQEQEESLLDRFQSLVGRVREITSEMATLKRPDGVALSEAERPQVISKLSDFDSQLLMVIEQMRALRGDAKDCHMKNLERDIDALTQSVDAARRKLSAVTDGTVHVSSAKA